MWCIFCCSNASYQDLLLKGFSERGRCREFHSESQTQARRLSLPFDKAQCRSKTEGEFCMPIGHVPCAGGFASDRWSREVWMVRGPSLSLEPLALCCRCRDIDHSTVIESEHPCSSNMLNLISLLLIRSNWQVLDAICSCKFSHWLTMKWVPNISSEKVPHVRRLVDNWLRSMPSRQ